MTYKDITSYELACKVNKQKPTQLPIVKGLPKWESDDIVNSTKLKRVIRALNTNPKTGKVWEPNWFDQTQRKYSIWVQVKASKKQPGGSGFSLSTYLAWSSHSRLSARAFAWILRRRLCICTSTSMIC